jgi:hypothetical protein
MEVITGSLIKVAANKYIIKVEAKIKNVNRIAVANLVNILDLIITATPPSFTVQPKAEPRQKLPTARNRC